jgi:hypothetical protein
MKYKIALLLFVFAFGFVGTGCKDRGDLKDLMERLKQKDRDKDDKDDEEKFDCPRLELNYKDACKTSNGTVGYVDENCDCIAKITDEKTVDCPRLKLNYYDACKTLNGKVGYVNKDCDCVEKADDKKFDCPDMKVNFGILVKRPLEPEEKWTRTASAADFLFNNNIKEVLAKCLGLLFLI